MNHIRHYIQEKDVERKCEKKMTKIKGNLVSIERIIGYVHRERNIKTGLHLCIKIKFLIYNRIYIRNLSVCIYIYLWRIPDAHKCSYIIKLKIGQKTIFQQIDKVKYIFE